MRKLFVIFSIIFLLLLPYSVTADSGSTDSSVIFAVYDATADSYLLKPTPVSVSSSFSYLSLLDQLSDDGVLSVKIENGSPVSIQNTESGYILQKTQTSAFYLKTDNTVLDDTVWMSAIGNAGIVEIVFSSEALDLPKEAILSKNSITAQGEATVTALTEAGHWLSMNQDSTTLYFMAMTASNQSLSPSDVATLPAALQAQPPEDAQTAAEELLMLSACGYSQTNQAVSERVAFLASCQIDTDNGDLLVQVLRALDSRNYTLPDNAENTRFSLCSRLLLMQNEDGGFSTNKGFASSPWTTLDAMLVLSNYSKEDETVANAIRNAASYISNLNQTSGLAHATTYSSTRILAKMISALICNQIDPSEDRFAIDGVSPIDYLLARQNEDGGFCAEPGEASSLEATETAALALSALNKGRNPYLFSSAAQEETSLSSLNEATPSALANSTQPPWLMIGIVAGCVVLFVVIIIVILYRRKKKS